MDPNLFDKINALQNYQNQQSNQANLQQLKANQAELAALREQLAEEANKPQCPHCGGPSEKGFDRCKNCGQQVIWCGPFVGKPGTMPQLQKAVQEFNLEHRRKYHAETKRRKEIREKERKLWEAEHPGHKWENRWEVEAQQGDSVNVGCILIALMVLGIVIWSIWAINSMPDPNSYY
jgi:hypothetical protein